jgi:hypothetical protein
MFLASANRERKKIVMTLDLFRASGVVLLTVFASLNLLRSAFTGFCAAALLFTRLGIRSGEAFR